MKNFLSKSQLSQRSALYATDTTREVRETAMSTKYALGLMVLMCLHSASAFASEMCSFIFSSPSQSEQPRVPRVRLSQLNLPFGQYSLQLNSIKDETYQALKENRFNSRVWQQLTDPSEYEFHPAKREATTTRQLSFKWMEASKSFQLSLRFRTDLLLDRYETLGSDVEIGFRATDLVYTIDKSIRRVETGIALLNSGLPKESDIYFQRLIGVDPHHDPIITTIYNSNPGSLKSPGALETIRRGLSVNLLRVMDLSSVIAFHTGAYRPFIDHRDRPLPVLP